MISFGEFLEINEELNYRITNEVIEFEDRWFYYDEEDEIIYGCDDTPNGCLFSFNPGSCEVLYNDNDKLDYDINNPICVITLKNDKSKEFAVYTENAMDYLKSEFGYKGTDVKSDRIVLQDALDKYEDYRVLIIYGKELVASTFDIIEEN